jgi:hypothetical protein
MASIYKRKDSPFFWIRFKDSAGAWKSANTGYRKDNLGDRSQVKKLVRMKSLEEMANKPARNASQGWEEWVGKWMRATWGDTSSTAKRYGRYFWSWLEYFREIEVPQPSTLRQEHVLNYLDWRKKRGGGRNTAIYEIKWLAQCMDEAVNRGYASTNPARKLRITKAVQAEKVPWSGLEVETVGNALRERDKFGWMHVTFLMGLHQAIRLRQAQIPLSCIDFDRRIISYPADRVKGGKGYSQPIDPGFFATLQELVSYRHNLGEPLICEIPEEPRPPSVQWRLFLDGLGLKHLCHHGLRATWITQAALAGIPESLAKRFVNHASSQVHSIYQKITANDLLPMLDALALYKQNSRLLPSSA